MNTTKKTYIKPEVAIVELPDFCNAGLAVVSGPGDSTIYLAPHRDRFFDLDDDLDDAYEEFDDV